MKKDINAVLTALGLLLGIINLLVVWNADGKTIDKNNIRTFSGTVDAISIADKEKGTKSEISVAAEKKNKKMIFLVTSTTTIYGIKSAPLTLDKVKKGDKVKIRYTTTKEGLDEAISVRLAP